MGLSVGKVVAASVGSTVLLGGLGAYLFINGLPSFTPPAPVLDATQAICAVAKQRGGDQEANRCFERQATERLNPNYCDALVEVGSSQSSRAKCLRQVAVAEGDPKACKRTGSPLETDECLRDLAKLLEDATLCAQISKSELVDDCLSRVALSLVDIEPCGRIGAERARSRCISSVVDVGGDAQGCLSIAEPRPRANCVSTAARRGDPSLCKKLAGRERGECWNSSDRAFADFDVACDGDTDCLVALGRENIGACAAIKDSQAFLRAPCFVTAGTYGQRVQDAYCERLPHPDLRDECLDGIGRARGHGDSCAKIKDAKRRTDCVFAAGKVDPIYCRALSVASDVRRCIAASNFDTADGSVCQGLEPARQFDCQRATDGRLANLMMRVH